MLPYTRLDESIPSSLKMYRFYILDYMKLSEMKLRILWIEQVITSVLLIGLLHFTIIKTAFVRQTINTNPERTETPIRKTISTSTKSTSSKQFKENTTSPNSSKTITRQYYTITTTENQATATETGITESGSKTTDTHPEASELQVNVSAKITTANEALSTSTLVSTTISASQSTEQSSYSSTKNLSITSRTSMSSKIVFTTILPPTSTTSFASLTSSEKLVTENKPSTKGLGSLLSGINPRTTTTTILNQSISNSTTENKSAANEISRTTISSGSTIDSSQDIIVVNARFSVDRTFSIDLLNKASYYYIHFSSELNQYVSKKFNKYDFIINFRF